MSHIRTIDSHLHLWDLERGDYAWLGPQHGELFSSFTPELARTKLAQNGVDGAVLVQAEDSLADTAYLLEVAESNDWVLGVVGWVALDEPATVGDQLDEWLQRAKFCGVRHLVHDDPRADFLELDSVRASLTVVADRGVSFDVPDAWPLHLAGVTALASDLQELVVVVDHLGKPPRDADELGDWKRALAQVAAQPNTVAKLSGLHLGGQAHTSPALDIIWHAALDLFGPDRLMWGSDWPMTVSFGGYSTALAPLGEKLGELTASEQGSILGGTTARVYGLQEASA